MEKSKYNEEDSIGSLSMHSDDDGTSSAPLLPHSSTIKTDESMTFITSLEGLRGVAIIAVLCSHLWPPFSHFSWNLGMMGVSVFFALSGYLITGILLKMQSGLSLVHLPLFFASRTIRLAPSLFICVFGTTVLWINQGRGFDNLKGHALTVLLYVENIYCKEQGHKDQASIMNDRWGISKESLTNS
jgi:peptidoglycan/LPS O-acetylase OafA/YrhL